MGKDIVAAYDMGTGGVKIALIDKDFKLYGIATADYPLYTPQPDWAEQDPEDYWNAVCDVTRKVMRESGISADEIIGMSFSTQWKGIIPMDKDGKVLHRNIAWLDGRAGKQAEKLNEQLGTRYCDKDYFAKLLWFKENCPELYDRADCIHEVNSYLKFKITGEKSSDLSNHFLRSHNADIQKEAERFLDCAGIDINKFPPLVDSRDCVGRVTREASLQLGLSEGTPVFGGSGDIPAIAVGSGCTGSGKCHIYLGSSGWIGISLPEGSKARADLRSAFTRDQSLWLYAIQSACMSFNWAVRQMYRAEMEQMGEDFYPYINSELDRVPAGSLNLLATPWLHGELPPLSEHAKMVFLNISGVHERSHMVNAVMESLCYTLKRKMESLKRNIGIAPDRIRVAGGGASFAHWMQILADVLEIPVDVPYNPRHAGAFGIASTAFVGLGLHNSYEEAAKRVKIEHTYLPRSENQAVYHKLYDVFCLLYPTLKDTFDALNSID